MNRLAFMGVLAVGETTTRAQKLALPEGLQFLLTTPRGQAVVVGQDRTSITIKNVGDRTASYMIFAVDRPGLEQLAAVRQLVTAFSKPKRTP